MAMRCCFTAISTIARSCSAVSPPITGGTGATRSSTRPATRSSRDVLRPEGHRPVCGDRSGRRGSKQVRLARSPIQAPPLHYWCDAASADRRECFAGNLRDRRGRLARSTNRRSPIRFFSITPKKSAAGSRECSALPLGPTCTLPQHRQTTTRYYDLARSAARPLCAR